MKATTYSHIDITNYETLNRFLMRTLEQIADQSVAPQQSDAISKIADKIIKNNISRILDLKRRGDIATIPFFQPANLIEIKEKPVIENNITKPKSKTKTA